MTRCAPAWLVIFATSLALAGSAAADTINPDFNDCRGKLVGDSCRYPVAMFKMATGVCVGDAELYCADLSRREQNL